MLLLLVTPCLIVAVQPSKEWIPIKKNERKLQRDVKRGVTACRCSVGEKEVHAVQCSTWDISWANHFWKMDWHPKLEAHKYGKNAINFQNHKITGKNSCAKRSWSWNKNKRNKSAYWSADKSFFLQNFIPLFFTVSLVIVM